MSIGKPQIKKKMLLQSIKEIHMGLMTQKKALDILTSLLSALARSQGAALGWCSKCGTGAVADADGECRQCQTKIDPLEGKDGV